MKKFHIHIVPMVIALFVICGQAFGQKQPVRTSSAMAAYGLTPEPSKYKKKNPQKAQKKHHRKENIKVSKAARAGKTPGYRKRSNWAG